MEGSHVTRVFWKLVNELRQEREKKKKERERTSSANDDAWLRKMRAWN